MTILVATDGSRNAERAVECASRLARKMEDSLVVIHVTPSLPTTKENLIQLLKEELGSPREAGEKYLRRARRIALDEGVEAEVKLVKGSPAEEILKEGEKGYELIVLGHHGKGKVHDLLIGGVASKIIHLSKTPVLVVK